MTRPVDSSGVVHSIYKDDGTYKVLTDAHPSIPSGFTELAFNQVGPKGDKGDKGDTGPAITLRSYVIVWTRVIPANYPSDWGMVALPETTGDLVLGGGVMENSLPPSVTINGSYPSVDTNNPDSFGNFPAVGWVVFAGNSADTDQTVHIYANCLHVGA
jgi:hypothetical protein